MYFHGSHSLFYIFHIKGNNARNLIMKTTLLLLVKLRIEVGTTKKAKSKMCKCLLFNRIVKVLFYLIEVIGKLYKMIGLNR